MSPEQTQRRIGLRMLLRGKKARTRSEEVARKIHASFKVSGRSSSRTEMMKMIRTFDPWLSDEEVLEILNKVHPKKN